MKKAEKYSKLHLDAELEDIAQSPRKDELTHLTIYEKAIIYKYSNDGYESINEHLRRTNGSDNTELGRLLDSILSKLPDYKGLVYRGALLTQRELRKYSDAEKQTSSLTEPTFISTTKSRLIAREFGNTLFRIYSKTGKDIEKITKFGAHNAQNEKEVLFKPNRKFNVLGVTNETYYTLITLEEI